MSTLGVSLSLTGSAEALGYQSIGLENDPEYFSMACNAIPRLAQFKPPSGRNGSPNASNGLPRSQ